MAKEIERKFLVKNDNWQNMADNGEEIVQGYISTWPNPTVRIRTRGEHAYLTIKGSNHGIERDEWEYEIPKDEAEEMLKLCNQNTLIEKIRYRVGRWEIDAFKGRLSGLVLAEIELTSADEKVTLPDFIGPEVTDDSRYYNSSLASAGMPLQ